MRDTRTGTRFGQWLSKIHRATGVAAAGLAVVGLAACGGDDPDDDQMPGPDQGNSDSGESAQQPTSATEPPAGDTSFERDGAPIDTAQSALRTAADAVQNGQPFDVELESHDQQGVFDIKVASNRDEFKVLVSSTGDQVVSQDQQNEPSDDVGKLDEVQVDASQALETAAQQEPDASLREMEIDENEEDQVVWDIELLRADGSEVDYEVDANSGEIRSD